MTGSYLVVQERSSCSDTLVAFAGRERVGTISGWSALRSTKVSSLITTERSDVEYCGQTHFQDPTWFQVPTENRPKLDSRLTSIPSEGIQTLQKSLSLLPTCVSDPLLPASYQTEQSFLSYPAPIDYRRLLYGPSDGYCSRSMESETIQMSNRPKRLGVRHHSHSPDSVSSQGP